MRSIAVGLKLNEDFFDQKVRAPARPSPVVVGQDRTLTLTHLPPQVNERFHNLRLLSYPSVPAKLLAGGGSRAGAHSDYGVRRLLSRTVVIRIAQLTHPPCVLPTCRPSRCCTRTQSAGSRCRTPTRASTTRRRPSRGRSSSTSVRREGSLLRPRIPPDVQSPLLSGDLLSRWSNNVLRSTLHRVVAPPLREQEKADGSGATELATPARQSIAFFSNPVRALLDPPFGKPGRG